MKMRSWIQFSLLLLLSLMIHEAQGMRFIRKGTPSNDQHISHKTLKGGSNGGAEEIIPESVRNRKLIMNKEKATSKEEKLSVDSSSATRQQPPSAPETYPGILDIAGMDYSQARRKPPIHN